MSTTQTTYEVDADTVKIVLAFTCSIGVAATGIGAVLTIALLTGLAFGAYRSDPNYVRFSTRVVQYIPIAIGIFYLTKIKFVDEVDIRSPEFFGAILSNIAILLGAIALEYMWFRPLSRRIATVTSLGSRAATNIRELLFRKRGAAIMPFKVPSSYSAAEELKKWHD